VTTPLEKKLAKSSGLFSFSHLAVETSANVCGLIKTNTFNFGHDASTASRSSLAGASLSPVLHVYPLKERRTQDTTELTMDEFINGFITPG
jgi:hypothetical protein